MNIDELFRNLVHSRITLFIEGDCVRYRAPEGALTAEVRAATAEHRSEIIKRLPAGRRSEGGREKRITCDRQDWVDDPPKDGRIRTICSPCGRFIGYRPDGLREPKTGLAILPERGNMKSCRPDPAPQR